jgi:cholesterol oxidase
LLGLQRNLVQQQPGGRELPYMPTDVDRHLRQVAVEMGKGETFNKAPVGVYFGRPGVEAEDPYFGGIGPRRIWCISCGNLFLALWPQLPSE